MKKQIIFFLFIFLSIEIVSQELSTAGQSYLKFYKKNIEKLQKMDPSAMGYENEILQAEKQIKSLQKTDPSYNISSLNEEVAGYKEKLKGGLEKNEDDVKTQDNLAEELEIFLNTNLSITFTKEEVDASEKKITEFQTKFNGYLQSDLLKDPDIKYILPKIEKYWSESNSDKEQMSAYKVYSKNQHNENEALGSHCMMKLIHTKWQLLSNAFPQSTVLKEAEKQTSATATLLGNKDDIVKLAKVNKLEITAKERMKPAVTIDATVVEEIRIALKNCSYTKDRSIIKINVLSSDWSVERNKLTGIILRRNKYFEAALKNSDGSCILLKVCWYQQDHDGSGFGKGYITKGELHDILCENVNK